MAVGYTFPAGERLTPRFSEITSGPQQRLYHWADLWIPIPLPLFGPDTGTGLINNNGVLQLVTGNYYPTSPAGLSPGDLWNNFLTIGVVGPTVPNPNAPPIIFGTITAFQLLEDGGYNLPLSDAFTVIGQLWNNNGLICVSFGFGSLIDNGGVLQLVDDSQYPTSPLGLPAGAVWNNFLTVAVVPGVTPDPSAPGVYFGSITAQQLLALGGGNLPLSDIGLAFNQLWNNSGLISVGGETGLANDDGVLIVTVPGWPSTSSTPGACYSNGGVCSVVPGIIPNPFAPAVFFPGTNAAALLALGGGNLPLADPGVLNQLWNHSGEITISNPVLPIGQLFNDGGFLMVLAAAGYLTSATGLPAGSIWSNSSFVNVVPGIVPNPSAPPVYYGSTTAVLLEALGGGNLPLTQPTAGSLQLWNNNNFVCVA